MSETMRGEMLPISSLNALDYCPRSFYYQVVQGETPDNEFLLEGTLAHKRVHQPGTRVTEEGVIETTRLYLVSETLHLSGFADVIEEREGMLVPVEYKSGKEGHWPGQQIQLCAQALCLEERLPERAPITHGSIYYVASRRRVEVPFTPQVRARTRAAIVQAFQVASLETPPPPLTGKLAASRCPSCGLLPLCLPEEVRRLRSGQEQ